MVQGLKSFIKYNIPDAREIITIEQKIDEWKRDNIGATPIIVFDFPGFYRSICVTAQAQLDVLFCKHQRSLNTTEYIFKRLRSKGVQLEFFCGGSSRFITNPNLINQRRQQLSRSVDNILDMIKLENCPEEILKNTGCLFNNASYWVAVVMLAAKYGRVHKSYYYECEQACAVYASQHNAIAVMSRDSDFILINGQWNFWDVAEFDLEQFKILQFNKNKIQDYLQLQDDEMPLISVFMGHHFPDDLCKKFLQQFGKSGQVYKLVANFIIKNFRNKTPIVPKQVARFLSSKDLDKNAQTIEKCLVMFANRSDPDGPVVEDELSIVAKGIHNSYVYEFLNDLAIPVQPLFLRKSSFTKFMNAALEIHQRQMGIILQHKPSEKNRKVICFNDTNITVEVVCPIYPTMKVPPLLQLYQDTENNVLLKTKLKLLSWIASDLLDYTTMENIPKPYLCAVVTLVYMVENQLITSEEADCILYCLQQYNLEPELMDTLTNVKLFAERPFQVIFLYDKFHQFMAISMNTVGLSNLLTYNQLDGVFFHQQYEHLIHMSTADREILLEEVKDYRIY